MFQKFRNHFSATHLLLFLLLTSTSFPHRHHLTADAYAFIYADCSPAKIPPNTPFQSNLVALLTSMTTSATQTLYSNFAVGNNPATSPPDAAVYGLYQCRNDLSVPDCAACVGSAVGQVGLVCGVSLSASLQLDGCLVRYAHDNFVGRLETALVYKKCGAGVGGGGDVEFFRRRDDVLADLRNGVGFRVSSSGGVEGYGQCLGDLSPPDCTACFGAAVGQLVNACGSALEADVFLGKCFARYWASGFYPPSTPDLSEDNIGKTVAIIVGILAGLVLIVIFLAFLRRVCD